MLKVNSYKFFEFKEETIVKIKQYLQVATFVFCVTILINGKYISYFIVIINLLKEIERVMIGER